MTCYIPRWFTRPQTVTHPSTNQAQYRLTTLIKANALTTPLSHHLPERSILQQLQGLGRCDTGVTADLVNPGGGLVGGRPQPHLHSCDSHSLSPWCRFEGSDWLVVWETSNVAEKTESSFSNNEVGQYSKELCHWRQSHAN